MSNLRLEFMMVLALPLVGYSGPVQFNRDVRPILSENCFACHGPDSVARKADLRLDRQANALASRDGVAAVVPGQPGASELIRRITNPDPDEVMPPPKSGKTLTPAAKEILQRWIEEGADWQEHWAFIAPRRPEPPAVERMDWPRNPIDSFILARLAEEGLGPSKEADRETLIRRVTLDLTGLPPSPEEIDRFLVDAAPGAYERVVDRLLRSSSYGEHMARDWLDGARYGDTHGLHLDNERSIWPYRDWVVRAFNENMAFDQFTLLQVGGDLLPNPEVDQLVATGFNRCNVTTSEGGAIPEEFRLRYAVDRIETLSTVFMGLTAGCAVCHDHKFDPVSQKEFYQLMAFYNSMDENPMDGNALLPPPAVRLATPEQERQLAALEQQAARIRKVIDAGVASLDYEDPFTAEKLAAVEPAEFVWIEDDLPEGAKASDDESAWQFVEAPDHPVHTGRRATVRTAEGQSQHYFTDAKEPLRIGSGDRLFAYVFLDPGNPPKEVMLQFHSGKWEHRAYWGENLVDWGKDNTTERFLAGPLPEAGEWVRLEVAASQVGLRPGARIGGWAFTQHGGTVYWDRAGVVSTIPQGNDGFDSFLAWEQYQGAVEKTDLPDKLAKAVKKSERTEAEQAEVRNYFLERVNPSTRSIFAPLQDQGTAVRAEREALDRSIPRSLVAKELKEPRPTHVLLRGAYDSPGALVEPEVPAALPGLPADAPRNRLGLARWLVDPAHPLTARVTANRFWQHYFGIGLVRTSEDFGSQGEPPSHPKLLDWLATEFIASGWDVRALQRLIVTSATYRQCSNIRPELLTRDPSNRLLARGPRVRLDAEVIRDAALAISGLLVNEVGGRGVKPYQPEGIWKAVAYPSSTTATYRRDNGQALYRRTLYTFWKRTAPPPSMTSFDAPSRESCRVRRERTNTPLQALVLMNDEQFVEAARALAERMLAQGGAVESQLTYGYRWATAHRPEPGVLEVLRRLFQEHLADFQADQGAAEQLVQVGESAVSPSADSTRLAAMTMVANLLLNLNETITKN